MLKLFSHVPCQVVPLYGFLPIEELTSGLVSIDGLRLDRGMWMGSDANCFVSVAKILNYTLYDLHTTYSKYINNELAA